MVPDDPAARAQELIRNGTNLKAAARKVGVSHQWLRRRLNGECVVSAKNGPAPVLRPDEERALVDTVIHRAAGGFGVTRKDLKEKVDLIASDGRATPWGASGPGKKWLKLFLQRHRGKLSVRRTRILDSNRRAAGDKEEIKHYFEAVKEVLAKHNIKSSGIYNCDESGQ
jgi:hypothetical protein